MYSVQDIRTVTKTFKKDTTRMGGWHPRQVGFLTDGMLEALRRIWFLEEWAQVMGSQESQLFVRLLGKRNGGWRPIMLYRTMFRIQGKLQARKVRGWLKGVPQNFQRLTWLRAGRPLMPLFAYRLGKPFWRKEKALTIGA